MQLANSTLKRLFAAGLLAATASSPTNAQLLSAYDGDEPGPRSWITETSDGSFVTGPLSRGEALASDEDTDRIFASSGSEIRILRLVGDDTFQSESNVSPRDGQGKSFRSIQSLAFGAGTLYAYNVQRQEDRDPESGLYDINLTTGKAMLLLSNDDLQMLLGGTVSGMAFDPTTGLYVMTFNMPQAIYSLDPVKGTSAMVVEFPDDQFRSRFDGLGFGGGRFFMTAGNGPIGVYNMAASQFEPNLPSPPRFGNGPGGSTFASFTERFTNGPGEILGAPTSVSAFGTVSYVRVSWSSSLSRETNFSFFTVYRSLSPEGPFAPITQTTDSSYFDTDTLPGTTYVYYVDATDKSGREGAPSRIVSATKPGEPQAQAMYVERIVPKTKTNRKGRVQGRVVVRAVDSAGNPIENVVVSGTFSGAYNELASAVTNGKGRAVVKTAKRIDAVETFDFCVESLERVGITYDASKNEETCDTFETGY